MKIEIDDPLLFDSLLSDEVPRTNNRVEEQLLVDGLLTENTVFTEFEKQISELLIRLLEICAVLWNIDEPVEKPIEEDILQLGQCTTWCLCLFRHPSRQAHLESLNIEGLAMDKGVIGLDEVFACRLVRHEKPVPPGGRFALRRNSFETFKLQLRHHLHQFHPCLRLQIIQCRTVVGGSYKLDDIFFIAGDKIASVFHFGLEHFDCIGKNVVSCKWVKIACHQMY